VCVCDGKLVDNFSPESDVTSLKTPSRHVPTRPLSNFTIVFPVKSEEAFFQNNDCPASSFPDLLASCRAVLVMRIQHRLSLV